MHVGEILSQKGENQQNQIFGLHGGDAEMGCDGKHGGVCGGSGEPLECLCCLRQATGTEAVVDGVVPTNAKGFSECFADAIVKSERLPRPKCSRVYTKTSS